MKPEALEQQQIVKRLAAFEITASIESRSKMIDEHGSAFRWMVASLFALNGGSILSIFGSDGFGAPYLFLSFWVFFAGIIFTFATVIMAQISDRKMIAQLHSWGLYWTRVSCTGVTDLQHEKEIKDKISDAENFGRQARVLGFFAMMAFVVGVLTAAVFQQKFELEKLQIEVDRLSSEASQSQ